jgi:hypothetical protein
MTSTMTLPVNYKLSATDPATVTVTNLSGTPYASHTGTPTNSGRWLVHIVAGFSAEAALMAEVSEYETWNLQKRVPVVSSGTFTSIVPGMSITLGTIAAGNSFRVVFSRLTPEAP